MMGTLSLHVYREGEQCHYVLLSWAPSGSIQSTSKHSLASPPILIVQAVSLLQSGTLSILPQLQVRYGRKGCVCVCCVCV